MKRDNITINLEHKAADKLIDSALREGLSACARTGNYLWMAGDEQVSIQRVEKLKDGSYGNCKSYFIKDFIKLPSKDDEVDIEGLDYNDGYLWIIGSHSFKRKNIDPSKKKEEKAVHQLTKISKGRNRNLLVRIPCIPDEKGEFTLHKKTKSESAGKKGHLFASNLKHKKKHSELSKLLKKDKHLQPFMKLPGKDNGFNIEGISVIDNRLFLGLRGPVLRGWAIILEIWLKTDDKGRLRLKKNKELDTYYVKHFLNLYGMGIRELASDGNDLLILAGPTMDLDGSMAVYRWKQAQEQQGQQLIEHHEVDRLFDIPFHSASHGVNKAEGMACIDKGILILYDSPGYTRTRGDWEVKADLFTDFGP